jgi:beta-glucanase (GH16 family)
MTLLTIACVAALIAMLGVVVTRDPTGGQAPAPPPAPAPSGVGGGTDDPWHPDDRSTLGPARSDTEAAVKNNWPMIANDEFDGTSLDRSKWNPYTGQTTGGVGRHREDNLSVRDGLLTITSKGKTSGGMAWANGQQYGRWEIRAKTNVGTGYGDVALLWPDAEDWPEGGEINFMEIPKGDRKESHFIVHYGEDNSQVGHTTQGDFTQWHNYAVEWAPDHVAGFIDGQEVFRTTDRNVVPPRPMHLALQQDIGPYGNDWIPPLDASSPETLDFQVDWVRIYGL